QFYQFWINVDDSQVESFLKVYTEMDEAAVNQVMSSHSKDPGQRIAQRRLAKEVTSLVHGGRAMRIAEAVTDYLTGKAAIGEAGGDALKTLRREIPQIKARPGVEVAEVLKK